MISHVTRMGEEVNSQAFSEREVAKIFWQPYSQEHRVFQGGYSEGQDSLMQTHLWQLSYMSFTLLFWHTSEINTIQRDGQSYKHEDNLQYGQLYDTKFNTFGKKSTIPFVDIDTLTF